MINIILFSNHRQSNKAREKWGVKGEWENNSTYSFLVGDHPILPGNYLILHLHFWGGGLTTFPLHGCHLTLPTLNIG